MSSLSRELVFLILQFLEEEKFKESVHKYDFFTPLCFYGFFLRFFNLVFELFLAFFLFCFCFRWRLFSVVCACRCMCRLYVIDRF